MREITVHAGWEGDAIIGKVFVQEIRGKENFSFEYDLEWLKKHENFVLDPDIENREGMQYPPSGKKIFGFLSDVSPDRWGKKLIQRFFAENSGAVSGQRREQRDLSQRGGSSSLVRRRILESDYILGVSDKTRQGGVRLSENGVFLSSSGNSVPPITSLRELEEASMQLEKHEGNIGEILHKLLFPGSSLGGARPKANVADVDGSLWIAKFPSRYDEVDVGAWEMVIHDLAKKCGLNVPPAKLIKLSENRSTFLSKRFDRNEQGNRIHFASAMTMLGEVDGSDNLKSYLDIADFIDKQKGNTHMDLHELWNRVVFNICVSNTDDHLRNHGFLLNPQSDIWELSPAYDINPSPDNDWMELAIDFDNTSKDLMFALDTCLYYHIEEDTAVEEITRIQKVVRENWAQLANKYGIPKREQERMERAFLQSYNEIKALENIMNNAPIVNLSDFKESVVQSTGGARSEKHTSEPNQSSGLCSGEEDVLDLLNDSANDDLGMGESDRPGTAADEITEVLKEGIDIESL